MRPRTCGYTAEGAGARGEVRQVLEPALSQLCGEGLGQLGELLDGDRPHRPGGAIASATAVAEVLRAFAEEVARPAARHGRSQHYLMAEIRKL